MNYRTQKILLTGKISDELRDYFVWLCHQSNNLYNILKKVAVQLGISLVEAGRGALTLPKRYHLHLMCRSYRKNGETVLQPVS